MAEKSDENQNSKIQNPNPYLFGLLTQVHPHYIYYMSQTLIQTFATEQVFMFTSFIFDLYVSWMCLPWFSFVMAHQGHISIYFNLWFQTMRITITGYLLKLNSKLLVHKVLICSSSLKSVSHLWCLVYVGFHAQETSFRSWNLESHTAGGSCQGDDVTKVTGCHGYRKDLKIVQDLDISQDGPVHAVQCCPHHCVERKGTRF